MDFARALVTGASSGIGRAFATQLAAAGASLVLVARNEARLNELAASLDVDCEVLVADLSDPTQLETVAARIQAQEKPVDLVINNAGFGTTGLITDHTVESQEQMVAVNVTALLRLSHAAGVAMKSRGRGGILNVSSVAGFLPAPESSTYAATKAFVTSFSQSMHAELAPTGVHVSCLCPGFTRTEFQDRADYDATAIPDKLWQSAEQVAQAGLQAVAKNKAVEVPGVHNKIGAGLLKLTPGSAVRKISGLLSN